MEDAGFKRDRAVLDTSLFVNPDVRRAFGDTPTEALESFLFLAAQAPVFEFYMPPSVFSELRNFIEPQKISGDLLVYLHQKPPKKHEIAIPGYLLYELLEEIRERVNRGLRVAERAARNPEGRPTDELVQDLRRKYREALREGIIDSKEDVDLILLSRELNALLVTADQGVIKWADKLGIRWLIPEKFKDYMTGLIKKSRNLQAEHEPAEEKDG
jgi:RNA ligase partner protein